MLNIAYSIRMARSFQVMILILVLVRMLTLTLVLAIDMNDNPCVTYTLSPATHAGSCDEAAARLLSTQEASAVSMAHCCRFWMTEVISEALRMLAAAVEDAMLPVLRSRGSSMASYFCTRYVRCHAVQSLHSNFQGCRAVWIGDPLHMYHSTGYSVWCLSVSHITTRKFCVTISSKVRTVNNLHITSSD